MDLTSFEKKLKEISCFIRDYEVRRKEAPGYMNVLYLMGRTHLENEHSRVIAFLLDPWESHNHPEFGDLFIKQLNAQGKDIIPESCKIVNVFREAGTNERRRIDLLIEVANPRGFIIIENKINAGDLKRQLSDYIKYVHEEYKINPVVLYLNRNASMPSEYSIEEEKLKEVRFQCISYSEFMLSWIKQCLDCSNNEKDTLLKSALMQYFDVLKILTNKKEIYHMDEKFIDDITKDEEMLSAYFYIRALPLDNTEIAKRIILTKAIPAIKQVAERNGLELLPPDPIDDALDENVDWGFHFRKKEWKTIRIFFPFAPYFQGLWYGFLNNSMTESLVDELTKRGFKGHHKNKILYKPIEEEKYSDWRKPDVLIELCRPDNEVIKTIEGKIKDLLKIVEGRNDI
jgi:hypothetical protein